MRRVPLACRDLVAGGSIAASRNRSATMHPTVPRMTSMIWLRSLAVSTLVTYPGRLKSNP